MLVIDAFPDHGQTHRFSSIAPFRAACAGSKQLDATFSCSPVLPSLPPCPIPSPINHSTTRSRPYYTTHTNRHPLVYLSTRASSRPSSTSPRVKRLPVKLANEQIKQSLLSSFTIAYALVSRDLSPTPPSSTTAHSSISTLPSQTPLLRKLYHSPHRLPNIPLQTLLRTIPQMPPPSPNPCVTTSRTSAALTSYLSPPASQKPTPVPETPATQRSRHTQFYTPNIPPNVHVHPVSSHPRTTISLSCVAISRTQPPLRSNRVNLNQPPRPVQSKTACTTTT